jgi:hypothetical protein
MHGLVGADQYWLGWFRATFKARVDVVHSLPIEQTGPGVTPLLQRDLHNMDTGLAWPRNLGPCPSYGVACQEQWSQCGGTGLAFHETAGGNDAKVTGAPCLQFALNQEITD